MRPVVIVSDFAVPNGGAAILALTLARGLAARGVSVTYLSGDAPRDLGPIRHVGLGAGTLLQEGRGTAMSRGLWNREARSALSRLVAKMPGALFHVHGWAQILSPSIFAALRPVASRTVIHAHDAALNCPNGVAYVYGRDEPCARVALSPRCLSTGCDKRSAVHKAWRSLRHARLRSALRGAPWGAVALIHPSQLDRHRREGFDGRTLRVHRNPAMPWATDRIPAEERSGALFVGRLDPGKGARLLARAAARAEVPLTVVGDGPVGAEVTSMEGVTMAGWQDRAGIAEIAPTTRFLVMPSRFPEPFGLAAAEASRSGLPVIVSDRCGVAADVERLGIGRSVPAEEDALATALRTMSEMPKADLRRMSERGHSGGGLGPTEDGWVDGLMDLYAELGG